MSDSQKTRDSFIFYRSFFEAINDLPESNQLEVYRAISQYSLNFIEPNLSGISKTILTLIKPQLEANRKRFENGCKDKINKQTISKTEAKDKQTRSKPEANKNVNDNVNVECKSKLESKSKSKLIDLPNSISIELWNNFVKMRKEIKKPITESIAEACIEKLIKFEAKKIGNANLSLQNSIAGGYQGLFEPKQDFSKNDSRRDVFQQFLNQDQ